MNKYAAIFTLALIGAAAAVPANVYQLENLADPETQLSLTPSNEEETAGLVGDATIFADFCIKSRDYVIGDIKHQTNSLASGIFTMFFKTAESIGQNALNVESDAVSKLGNQIANPDAAIAAAGDDAASAIIAEGQQKIHDAQTQPQTFFQAVVSTIGATANSVSSGVVASLNNLKGAFGVNKVIGAVSSVCDQVAHYEDQNKAAFAEFAKSIAAKDAALAATPFENVACLTTRRISRLDGICKFSAVAQAPVQKILKSVA